MAEDQKSSFDKLVMGLSLQDRQRMLSQISSMNNAVSFSNENDLKDDIKIPLVEKLQKETFIYRFFLFIRSLISRTPKETLYNEDLLADIGKTIDKNYPNLLNYRYCYLDSIFYERLRNLQNAANFFKPYFSFIKEDFGDFYVFLSSFVAPELSEAINQEADPFQFGPEKDATAELRNSLIKKADDIVKNMDASTKSRIYDAVTASTWLMQFSDLPFLHFISQFTDIANSRFTCPFGSARNDFNVFAAVFDNIQPISSEIIQAIFLFSQRRSLSEDFKEKNLTKVINEFLSSSDLMFQNIQDFVKNVPFNKVGKLVNNNYEWVCDNIQGAEAWFGSFRTQWKKVIELRWDDWQRERKKMLLGVSLKSDFNLEDFPLMPYAPWKTVWSKIKFSCDLTGGFIAWYSNEKYEESIEKFNVILMDGIFIKSENKKEFTDSISDFTDANEKMISLCDKLNPMGEWGSFFSHLESNKVKTMQVQNQIDSIIRETQKEVRDIMMKFCKSARGIEAVLKGIFDEKKDGVHESLQNLTIIGGRNNQFVKDQIQESRLILKKTMYYISELEQIDAFVTF